MMPASPATVSPASRQAAGEIGVRVRTAAIGSANSRVSVPSAWITETAPKPSATVCVVAPSRVSPTEPAQRPRPRCPRAASRSWTTAAAA